MNGLNKQSIKKRQTKKWRKALYFSAILYVIIFVLLIGVIYQIPTIYQSLEDKRTEQIKKELDQTLNLTPTEEIQDALEELRQNENIELVVLLPEEVLYTTQDTTDFEVLKTRLNPATLSYQSTYEKQTPVGKAVVWLAIYHLPDQQFFTFLMTLVFVGVLILSMVLVLLFILMFRKLIHPIKRLKNNIFKLKNYRLTEVEKFEQQSEYDVLSDELSDFTEDLHEKIGSLDTQYTLLERKLQAKQEEAIYEKQLLTSLIHDLKTPLNISLLNIEQISKRMIEKKDPTKYLTQLEQNNESLIHEINDMLKVIQESPVEKNKEVQTIDLLKIVRDTMRLFEPIFKEKNIQYTVDVPRTVSGMIAPIELKQILHNIISNVCQYTDNDGEFVLEIDEQDCVLIIKAYNDKKETQLIDFEHVFDLFYHVNTTDAKFGSGVGMYTIKNMVEYFGGSCLFEPFEKGVLLTLNLPLDQLGAIK